MLVKGATGSHLTMAKSESVFIFTQFVLLPLTLAGLPYGTTPVCSGLAYVCFVVR